LREHPDALSQHVAILLLEELAHKRRQIHPRLRHRVNTSVSSFSGQRELTERCAMAALAVYAAVIEFPPRAGTLTRLPRAKAHDHDALRIDLLLFEEGVQFEHYWSAN